MHKGSCLCGGVAYEFDGEIGDFIYCHCGQCRKAQGSAFASNAPVPEDKVRFVSGTDLLKGYESSPGKQRVFCSNCGSPIYSKFVKAPGVLRLRLGLLDTPIGHGASHHIHAASKADWHEITDDLPQHAER